MNNIQQLIKQLAEQEGVSEVKIKEIVIDSFRTSYCKGENAGAELHFEFDSGLSVFRLYKIVETINNPEKEITKDNNLLKEGKIKGSILLLPINIKNFPFLSSQEIENRLRKDFKEISWTRQYKLYKSRQGEIGWWKIKGSIEIQGKKYYSVDLGKEITGHWEKSESSNLREEPRPGQTFCLLIGEVKEKPTEDTPQIILTRTNDLFIRKLLELEIPQIKNGVITVHDILRSPGVVSKILVERSKTAIEKGLRIRPAGTCIGEGGGRVRSISEHLNHSEQIHFVDWTEDKKQLLAKLLWPTQLVKLIIKKEKEWEVVVSYQKQYEEEILKKIIKKISDYLGINIHLRLLKEHEEAEFLANKGQILQEISSYKNIDVRIVEEVEK